MTKIAILNGPNLNMLGTREPEIYGHQTLQDIANLCGKRAESHGFEIDFQQTNSEGALVDLIQAATDNTQGLILNAAAFTHTSVAVADAVKFYPHPVIEVHLSNIYARETFRHQSYLSPLVQGGIFGMGSNGYLLALDAMKDLLAG